MSDTTFRVEVVFLLSMITYGVILIAIRATTILKEIRKQSGKNGGHAKKA